MAVGYYGLTEAHGFARRPTGTVTTIDAPGASNTFVYGTNDDGQVVGSYVDADGREHSFLLERGAMTVVDHPDAPDDPAATNTAAVDLNDREQVLLPAPGGFFKGRAVPIGG
jgi:probable HAF family extracellular repeat protein